MSVNQLSSQRQSFIADSKSSKEQSRISFRGSKFSMVSKGHRYGEQRNSSTSPMNRYGEYRNSSTSPMMAELEKLKRARWLNSRNRL